MKRFVSYEKLSKKKKREINAAKRATWGALNPATRKPKNPKAYDRASEKTLAIKKVQKGDDELHFEPFCYIYNKSNLCVKSFFYPIYPILHITSKILRTIILQIVYAHLGFIRRNKLFCRFPQAHSRADNADSPWCTDLQTLAQRGSAPLQGRSAHLFRILLWS